MRCRRGISRLKGRYWAWFAQICGCGGMVDAGDLKSPDPIDRAGSSPATRTILNADSWLSGAIQTYT